MQKSTSLPPAITMKGCSSACARAIIEYHLQPDLIQPKVPSSV